MLDIEVTYHPDTYKELFEDVLRDYPGFTDGLRLDFADYASGKKLPIYFGKDDVYTHPYLAYTVKLQHIHLALPPDKFKKSTQQADRKCKRGRPGQDAALVYVRGLYEDHRYCLLAVLHPDAHGRARDDRIMSYLSRLAKEFRDQN
jgi:mRNA interferase YafO